MARIEFSGPTLASPVWAGDFLNREHLVPGGARLDPTDFEADDLDRKPVPSGTAIGRTIAERDAATGFGPADAADDEIYLTAFDVTNAVLNADVELYRSGSIVKENFLPGIDDLDADVLTALRAKYTCTLGAE